MNLEINLVLFRFELVLMFFEGNRKSIWEFTSFRFLLTFWRASVFGSLLRFEKGLRPEYLMCGYNLNYGSIFKQIRWSKRSTQRRPA
jgi:hypothetical protein